MQNVIYAVIGVILTVAAMYMVAPSINNSSEAIKANLAATEVSAVKNAAKMWLATESTDGKFTGMYADDLTTYLPELAVTGTDASSKFTSKAGNGVTISLIPDTITTTDDSIKVTAAGLTNKQATLVANALKDLTSSGTAPAPTGSDNNKSVEVKIKG